MYDFLLVSVFVASNRDRVLHGFTSFWAQFCAYHQFFKGGSKFPIVLKRGL